MQSKNKHIPSTRGQLFKRLVLCITTPENLRIYRSVSLFAISAILGEAYKVLAWCQTNLIRSTLLQAWLGLPTYSKSRFRKCTFQAVVNKEESYFRVNCSNIWQFPFLTQHDLDLSKHDILSTKG